MSGSNYRGPGVYRHYKGGHYKVTGLAFNERSKEAGFDVDDPVHQMVVYRPLSPGSLLHGTTTRFWLRPLRDFDAQDVEWERQAVRRFEKLTGLRRLLAAVERFVR